MEEKYERQEIDIIEIFAYVFKLFKKKKYYILFFFIIGLLYGSYRSIYKQKSIEQTIICETRVISSGILIKIVFELQEKIANNDINELPEVIKKPNTLSTISSIRIDTLKDQNAIIKFTATNLADISEAKKGFFLYLNTLFKSKIEKELKSKDEVLSEINKTYTRLDSMQKFVILNNTTHNNFYFGSLASKENFEAFELKHKLIETIAIIKKDGILSEISCSNKTISNNSLIRNLIIYSVASTLLIIILLFVIEFVRIINRRTK